MKEPIRLAIYSLCITALWLAAGCGNASGGAQSVETPTVSPELASPVVTLEPEPTPDEATATRIVAEALLALNTHPNRMEVTTVPLDGAVQTNIIEFIPPDRKRIVSVEQGVEYIIAGGVVYALTPASDAWAATEIPAVTFLGEPGLTVDAIAETLSEVQWLRQDHVEGQDIIVIRYRSSTVNQGIELVSLTELWIRVQDGLPVRMVTDGEILAASTDPESGESSLAAVQAQTTTFIEFDDSIVIEAP